MYSMSLVIMVERRQKWRGEGRRRYTKVGGGGGGEERRMVPAATLREERMKGKRESRREKCRKGESKWMGMERKVRDSTKVREGNGVGVAGIKR